MRERISRPWRFQSRPRISIAPASGGGQALDHLQGGGLAGAVGAQQAEHLAPRHVQVQAVHRHHLGVRPCGCRAPAGPGRRPSCSHRPGAPSGMGRAQAFPGRVPSRRVAVARRPAAAGTAQEGFPAAARPGPRAPGPGPGRPRWRRRSGRCASPGPGPRRGWRKGPEPGSPPGRWTGRRWRWPRKGRGGPPGWAPGGWGAEERPARPGPGPARCRPPGTGARRCPGGRPAPAAGTRAGPGGTGRRPASGPRRRRWSPRPARRRGGCACAGGSGPAGGAPLPLPGAARP